MKLFAVFGLVAAGSMINAPGAQVLEVKDIKGRAIGIELLGVEGRNVSFRRKNDPKEFRLALDQFDASSQLVITNAAKEIPKAFPKLDAEVVIGKRRDKGDSYYMVVQTVTCEVKLKNPSHDASIPKVNAKVLFVGQNQKSADSYTILSIQTFAVELAPGQAQNTTLKSFVTRYDSDNKGTGNIGGYQYSGYLMIFTNDKDEVVYQQTTDANIRMAIAADPKLLKAVVDYKKGDYVNAKLGLEDSKFKPLEN